MYSIDTPDITLESGAPESYDWALAFRVLGELLASNDGCISSKALRQELEDKHPIADARQLVVELSLFNPEASRERGIPMPGFTFHHLGRSFYSEEKYAQKLRKQEKEAEDASDEASSAEPEEPTASRTNRQEEARLVAYVKSELEDLYASDVNKEESPFVFDVHSLRKGSIFENVDLIAVHLRSDDVCELITVEVKLEFCPQVVQQALNYTRFSHRAWVAVRVETDSNRELRERNPNLFEYAISKGLGILACRRRQGKSYEVFPVHWPLRSQPDPLEQEEFLERYRDQFEEAGIVDRKNKRRLPRLR